MCVYVRVYLCVRVYMRAGGRAGGFMLKCYTTACTSTSTSRGQDVLDTHTRSFDFPVVDPRRIAVRTA